jgi:hypothetical protein
MGNVPVNGPYPAVQYEPTETPPTGTPVYHEDREVTLASATGSQMFRTYNAQFNPGATPPSWGFASGSPPAYATAQNSDGSIHYFTNPTGMTTWTTWAGSGNNAVYNGVDFGMSTANPDNTSALNSVITAALNGGGGEVFIPPGSYPISDVVDLAFTGVPGQDWAVIIRGVAGSTELVQSSITSDVFSVSGFSSGRGIRFQDLRITYSTTTDPQSTLAAAVRVINSQNVTCERVYFNNCPQAFYTESLEGGLFDCTITYDNFGVGGTGTVAPTMVYLGGQENYIDSCVISQTPRDNTPVAGPAGCIGVIVNPGGGAYYITNTHFSDFTQGIVVRDGPNLTRLFCSNVICESWTNSLVIQPTGSDTIQQVYCDDCLFARTNGSTDTTSTGVVVGTSGDGNSTLGEIFLNNCVVYQWNVAGVQVNSGQKIVITGGRYGSNAFNEGSTGGGIAIVGTAADITISGADLTPKLTNPIFPSQGYAISITAAVSGLYVRGCNMSGYMYPSGPLYLSSPGTKIEITDCAGYNDKGTPVATAFPSGSATFGSAFYAYQLGSTPYFGPIEFYTIGATVGGGSTITGIKMDGNITGLKSGSFYMGPQETAEIEGSSPISFLAIGK